MSPSKDTSSTKEATSSVVANIGPVDPLATPSGTPRGNTTIGEEEKGMEENAESDEDYYAGEDSPVLNEPEPEPEPSENVGVSIAIDKTVSIDESGGGDDADVPVCEEPEAQEELVVEHKKVKKKKKKR
jgi:hypothetical protein